MPEAKSEAQRFDVTPFFQACWQGKLWIVVSVVCAVAIGAFYAMSLPDIYRAEIVAAPTEEAQGGGQLSGQLGGLATLAGVNVGQGQVDKAAQALEILQSRQFLYDFIKRHDAAVSLMAAKGWDPETNELIIDQDIYLKSTNEWLREPKNNRSSQPTAWEMTSLIRDRILYVEQDQRTGIIRLSVEFYSPDLAQQWVSAILQDLNEIMRERDLKESEQSIRYLEEQMLTISLISMQQVFSQLIEKQMQTMMLANARAEYIFTTLDPALAPETKASPHRPVIIILFGFLGIFIGVLAALIKYFLWNNKTT
ncbi:hypothetical protein GPUN_2882 [Glaciecola punicea ACAM 611]|uniref:Polysaccharide chain length determinant N-terminal domain-containing protein n=1 Tax=Glaciecola punicea ACAM 611 TaxID=1121923 RepID=H5TF69_9ALTE|nr:Wzz/FepE/Etk N-terminal domain-containing protein [Glaciecola punicea]GAB56996.1 hypothetical protein GPUN_2882 [Glaciecola punicea ACAM 611]